MYSMLVFFNRLLFNSRTTRVLHNVEARVVLKGIVDGNQVNYETFPAMLYQANTDTTNPAYIIAANVGITSYLSIMSANNTYKNLRIQSIHEVATKVNVSSSQYRMSEVCQIDYIIFES